MRDLTGKCVLLGVTGGIAAYKMANVASALTKAGADVHVILTEHAQEFITPLTFETLTHNACVTDTFDRSTPYEVTHISLAKAADLILIAPATANIIAKLAHGIADDMLTTTVLAARCPKYAAPAMNTAMYENPITQENIQTLKRFGFQIILPASGHLACGDSGVGKLPEPEILTERVERELAEEKTMAGVRITVTAGPTREKIDPVRFLTNYSSGRMGYAIAREAVLRGADVRLISGPTALSEVPGAKFCPVESAADMFEAVKEAIPQTDILIMSAAVADFTPAHYADQKIHKGEGEEMLPLRRTQDILEWVGDHRREGLFVCGFSMETEDLLAHSREKLHRKSMDLIVANSIREEGAGFGVPTNKVTLITEDRIEPLPLMPKEDVAAALLDSITEMRK